MTAALAERLGVPTDRLAFGTGSVAVLYHLLQAACEAGDEVVYAWRSFEAYPIAVADHRRDRRCRCRWVRARCTIWTRCARRSPRRPGLCCSARPNNPTGPALRHAEVVAFVDSVPERRHGRAR